MKRLIIIGAGGFGREVLGWARGCPAYRREWEIAGFLDDRPDALDGLPGIGVPVLGNTSDYEPGPDDLFTCALGNPALRQELYQRFKDRGGEFARIIHESCIIGRNVDLGPGVILCPRVVLGCDQAIGTNTAMNVGSFAGHDSRIGAHCQVSNFCDITGHVQCGDSVMMGSRATIIPGLTIGNRAIVGAGSVVVSNVPEAVTVFGNPANIITRHA